MTIPTSFLSVLLKFLQALESYLMTIEHTAWNDLIYAEAFASLGKDITPDDEVNDRVACVHQLSTIIRKALEKETNFPIMTSTILLYEYLSKSPSWKEVSLPQYGDIITGVTGTGDGRIKNAHCGIIGKRNAEDGSAWIMSNDSRTGTWEANYTLNSWQRYYGSKGSYHAHFFRPEHLT